MHTVGIVPENSEILCSRCQCSKALNNFIRIGIALWIGILRYTPDTLHLRIVVDIFFNHIHIRTILMHRNRDHLKAESLCNLEMAIVSRCRTEEFDFVKLTPRCMSQKSEHISSGYSIVHHIQTGVAENHNIVRIHLSNRRQ